MNPLHIRRLPSARSCSIGSLAVTVFENAPTADEGREVMRVLGEVAGEHPQLMILTVIAANCGVPDGALRDLLTREVKRVQKQIKMVANVVEGVGFTAAALRSAVTGMTLMLRPEYPVKTFATVAEGAAFLAKGGVKLDQIIDAVDVLRGG